MSSPDVQHASLRVALQRRAVGAAVLWGVATLVALFAWDVDPAQALTIGFAYLIVITLLAGWVVIRTLVDRYPVWDDRTGFDRAFIRPRPSTVAPEALEAIRRTVSFSRNSAIDVHGRLMPLLRETADAHLIVRYGTGLDDEAAAQRLGPLVWEAVRPNLDRPDRDAPGMSLVELERIVSRLEELADR
jgi:hypothetical protein